MPVVKSDRLLGISWLWMGLESPRSKYAKLNGIDTRELTRELREHGIKLLGSSIVGMEHHTPENIQDEIEYAVSHETDFHQFMLYTPMPGTPLHREMAEQGRLRDTDLADIHGQYKFNFRHQAISQDDSKKFLDWAFWRDFERNGPSLYRVCRTTFEGWKRYRDHPDQRVRERFAGELKLLEYVYSGMLWAMELKLKKTNETVNQQIRALRQEMAKELGTASRLATSLLGPVLWWTTQREEKRLTRGKTYEPKTIIDRSNWALP